MRQLFQPVQTMSDTLQQNLFQEICEFLHQSGYTWTSQRAAVVLAIYTLGEVNDAEELWIYIYKSKKISLAAVYNCLNLLVRFGYLQKTGNEKRSGYKWKNSRSLQ